MEVEHCLKKGPEMSGFRASEQQTLYFACLEQLLPIAGERVQAVALDWWDLDRFLGLAFHVFLTDSRPQVRAQIAQLLPRFGAKAVPTLVVIMRQQALDPELDALVEQCLEQFDRSELVAGLLNVLKTSEDESFDRQVVTLLVQVGPDALAAVESLAAEPEGQALAQRILLQLQHQRLLDSLEGVFQRSLDHSATAQSLLKAAAAKVECRAYQQAIDIYTEAIQLCPDSAQAYGDRALLRFSLGEPQAAIADFRQAAHLFRQQGKTANCEVALGYIHSILKQTPNLI